VEGLEDEGKDFYDSRAIEPRPVVVHDVQARHAYQEVDGSRVIRGYRGTRRPPVDT
jgi:hypothetical protein